MYGIDFYITVSANFLSLRTCNNLVSIATKLISVPSFVICTVPAVYDSMQQW